MILHPQESVAAQAAATLVASPGHIYGTLTLTTHRLIFEAGGPVPYTVVDLDLGRVWNVHAGYERGGFLTPAKEYLTVETSVGRYTFETPNPRHWTEAIVRARGAPPVPPPPPPPPPPPAHPAGGGGVPGPPVVVNVAAPPAPKVMLTCRYCGALYDAVQGRCDRCGARP